MTSSDIYEADFKSSVMHNLVIVLKKVSVVADGSMIGHLLWERKLLRGSPDETEAASQRWFKKANELMEVKSSECSNNSIKSVLHFTGLVNFHFPCGKELQAHRRVLMQSSEVWNAHFSAEKTFADQKLVKVEDVSAAVFHKLLQWVYGTCPQLPSLQVIFDLLYLAEKYLIQDLQDLLIGKISEHLDNLPADTFIVSELNKTDNERVFEKVFKTVDSFILPLILDRQQLNLDFATVSLILSRPSLFCDEFRLARWLLAWASHNVPEEEQAQALVPLINWGKMSEAEVDWLLQRPEAKFIGPVQVKAEDQEVQSIIAMHHGGLPPPPYRAKGLGDFEKLEYQTHVIIPITFPLSAEQINLPVFLCPDGDTLVSPVISWGKNSFKEAAFPNKTQSDDLKIELRRMGSFSGKNDTIRDSEGFVLDLQLLRLVTRFVRDGKWVEMKSNTKRVNYKNEIFCGFPRKEDVLEDFLSGEKTIEGFLTIYQCKKSEIDLQWFIETSEERRREAQDTTLDDLEKCDPSVIELIDPSESHYLELNFLEKIRGMKRKGENVRERTPEPGRTPEPEDDDEEADNFAVSLCNTDFSDDEE